MPEKYTHNDFQYEITELKENPIHSIIKKEGKSEINFTLRDFLGEQSDLMKTLTEKKAQYEIDSAFAEKALNDFPEIADIPDEKLAAIARYFTKSQSIKRLNIEIPEYEKAISQNEQEIKFICDSFQIDLNSNEKNVLDVVEAVAEIPKAQE